MTRSISTHSRRTDRARPFRFSTLALCLVGAVMAGCQSTPPPNPLAARTRLTPLLEAWRDAQVDGGGCEMRRPTETPLVDCKVLTQHILRLAIEFPRDADVLLAAAVVAFDEGRRVDALKTLDALRRFAPVHPEAALLRARLAIDEGNLRFARRLLEEQRDLVPDHSGLWELLASIFYLQGDWPEAGRHLEIASRLGAPSWRAAYHRGLIAEAASRPEEAAKAYGACLRASPDFAPARSRLRALAVQGGLGPAAGSPPR